MAAKREPSDTTRKSAAKRRPRQPAKNSRKRATLLTQAVHDRIVYALGVGSFRRVAAHYGGITGTTFYRWMDKGIADIEAGDDTPHARLYEAVVETEAKVVVDAVELIQSAATKDWNAAKWFLERKEQAEWGGKQRVELSGGVQHEHDVKVSAADPVLPQGVTPMMLSPDMQKAIANDLAERRKREEAAQQN